MSISATFNALSDPNRQNILNMLKKGEKTVTELLEGLDVTMPTLSHHLDILKRANLVSGRREGQRIYYSLNLSVMEEALEKIIKFLDTKKLKK